MCLVSLKTLLMYFVFIFFWCLLQCYPSFYFYFEQCYPSFYLYFEHAASYQNPQGAQNEHDPNNTTVGISLQYRNCSSLFLFMTCVLLQIFVGNLDPNVTDDHLRQVFGQYGELVHVKIPAGKRCGFVQFADR